MTITNGYATLSQLKERLNLGYTYTASTISFDSATKKISDSVHGLKRFQTGDYIQVSGSASNDGYYTIATGNVAAEIVTSEALSDEAVGESVTITVVDDQTDDAILESMINAVSRMIDRECKRRFYTTDSDETRYYTAKDARQLWPEDDILSVTTLKTDPDGDRVYEETWETTDYDLWPYTAALDDKPYRAILVTPKSGETFPGLVKSVEVAGKFGYCAIASRPPEITEACLLQCQRLYKRKDAPFGVLGAAGMGQMQVIPELDPDVKMLIGNYIAR